MLHRYSLFVLIFIISFPSHAELKNTLAEHPSPYLAMHGKDPVNWQTWGNEAFKAARKQNKLLYVSSGYFSCHWCHVMQRESYQNPEIARLINTHFIPVKVDRELNPALDAYLINFLENTQGYSGWPLNVFITPQGHPLVGLVYQPPAEFKALLTKLNTLWQEDAIQLSRDAKNAAAELDLQNSRPPSHVASKHDIKTYQQTLLSQTWQLADEIQGGFGEQNKFPMVPQLQALLAIYEQDKDTRLGNFLRLSLDQMSSQGMYDQVGGGFYRYAVDPGWQIPHFEKMLYDNALLATLYFDAARVFKNPKYRDTALQTIDFILRDMSHKDGGFIASLSAIDNHNVEGGYYLWQASELKKHLNKDEYQLIRHHWSMSGNPTLDDGYHAVQHTSLFETSTLMDISEDQAIALYHSAQEKLLKLRSQRTLPKDIKRLAAWNALTLSALIEAISETKDEKYVHAANSVHHYLTQELWDGKNLSRALSDNKPLGNAGLEDYSLVTKALIDWGKYSKDEASLQLALGLNHQAWERFYDDGWQRSDETFLQYGNRSYLISDDVLPSPSATVIKNSLFLAQYFNDTALLAKTSHTVRLSHEILFNEPFWYVGYIPPAMSLAIK